MASEVVGKRTSGVVVSEDESVLARMEQSAWLVCRIIQWEVCASVEM